MNIEVRRSDPVMSQLKMTANGKKILRFLFQRHQFHFYIPKGRIVAVDQCDTIGVQLSAGGRSLRLIDAWIHLHPGFSFTNHHGQFAMS